MIHLVLAAVIFLPATLCDAGERVKVKSYFKKDGTFVESHERSRPNAYKWDNDSYRPSQEPYNKSYRDTSKNYGSDWTRPNSNRFNDDNPNNDYPPVGVYTQPRRPAYTDESAFRPTSRPKRTNVLDDDDSGIFKPARYERVKPSRSDDDDSYRPNGLGNETSLMDPSTGKFLGNVNSNRYDPDSISNPYGRYGNPYSPDSVNNPYGKYGNPYSNDSLTNPYATNSPVLFTPTPAYQPLTSPYGSGGSGLGSDDE